MVDFAEFLNSYSEWHYLWMGIFMGLTGGFALGVWARHRLRRFVHEDVVRLLALLGVRQDHAGGGSGGAGPATAPHDNPR